MQAGVDGRKDGKRFRLEGPVVAALAVIPALLLVLFIVNARGKKETGNAVSSEQLEVADAVTSELEGSKVRAYQDADRRDRRRDDTADSLWASISGGSDTSAQVGTSLSRVFGITDDMLVDPPAPAQEEPAPARSQTRKTPEPASEVEQEAPAEAHAADIHVPVVGIPGGSVLSSLDGASFPAPAEENPDRLVRCMFIRDEKVRNGQRVTLRILEEIRVGDMVIPANSHLTATCSLGDRLSLEVTSLQVNGHLVPSSYVAYDSDGLEGLYCPDTETSLEKASKGTRSTLISSGGSALSQSLSGLLGVGINAGTNAVSQAASTQSSYVQVTSGYQFYLLKNERRH